MATKEELEQIKEALVNHSIDEAKMLAEAAGWFVRAMRIDGKNCIGHCDFRANRINVHVENGMVTEVTGIG